MPITKKERDHYSTQHIKANFNSPEQENEYAKITTKVCSKCSIDKALTEYTGNTSGSDAFDRNGYRLRRPECIICQRSAAHGKNEAKQLAKKMGIPYTAPEGINCELCNKPSKYGDKLVFDHCHDSKKFRGYLHNSCNRSLGTLGDNIEGVVRTLNYILRSEHKIITQDPVSGMVSVPSAS
jgi:hypothetical protein